MMSVDHVRLYIMYNYHEMSGSVMDDLHEISRNALSAQAVDAVLSTYQNSAAKKTKTQETRSIQ